MKQEHSEKFGIPKHMKNIAPLCATVELSLWASYVKQARPVSILIIGYPELGGTEILKVYSMNPTVRLISQMTPYGIMKDHGKGILEGEITHLFLTDVSVMLGTGQQYTVRRNMMFMNSLIDEGLFKMSIYWGQFVPEGTPDKPIKCAMVAKIAKDIYADGRSTWAKMGLLSRMLPFSADYQPSDVRRIRDFIVERETREDFLKLKLPPTNSEFNVEIPEKIGKSLGVIAGDIMHSAERWHKRKCGYGFRATDNLKSLIKAQCLRRNYFHGLKATLEVNESDFRIISELSNWWNYDFNPLRELY